MIVSLIILGSLIAVGLPLYLFHKRDDSLKEAEDDKQPDSGSGGDECCGMHITCEKDSLLASVSDEILYYDDEELDVFKGRNAADYSESEIEQFRDVLITLLPDDIAGWGRSIQLRGINLPDTIRDELLMIVAEARQNKL